MNKRNLQALKAIHTLLEYKISLPCTIDQLKEIKESTDTGDIADYAQKVYSALQLKKVFDALELDEPEFEDFDSEEDKESLEESFKYSKEMFKF